MLLSKLIVSIGPASRDEAILQQLIHEGMNIARFNFSHADHAKTAEIISIIRTLKTPHGGVATMLDTKGPEIRSGDVHSPITYEKDEHFLITINKDDADQQKKILFCDYPYLVEDVAIGDSIIIDSGNLSVRVVGKQAHALLVQALTGAIIGSRRHINLPGISLRLPAMTEKDKEDLLRGITQDIDIIAASFIRTANHLQEIKAFLKENGGEHIPLIAKIENQEGLEHLEEIVHVADGIMIARGDLGVEVPIEDLPVYQKYILQTAKKYGKPVIYATELLKNMVHHPFPTRAEVSDIYHAVAAGHDALMLSDESAVGTYPIQSLETLARIAGRAEQDVIRKHTDFSIQTTDSYRLDKKYSARSAHYLVDELGAAGMVLFTKSGYFAKLASAYAPNAPIYAFTPLHETYQGLNFFYGVQAFLLEEHEHIEEHEHTALDILKKQGYVFSGDKIVIAYDGMWNKKRVAQVKVITI